MFSREMVIVPGCFFLFLLLLLPCGILTIVLLAGSNITLAIALNRAGIFLQIAGLLSVVPELLGENRLNEIDDNLHTTNYSKMVKAVRGYLKKDTIESMLTSTGEAGYITIVAIFLMSVLMAFMFFYFVFMPDDALDAKLGVAKLSFWYFSFMGVLWLILFPVLLYFEQRKKKPPMLLLVPFAGAHLTMSVMAFPLSAALAYSLKFIIGLSKPLLRFSFRQIIARVTFPLVFVGLLLQLFSTFG